MTTKELQTCKRDRVGVGLLNSAVAQARKHIEADPSPHQIAATLRKLYTIAHIRGRRKAELELLQELGTKR